MSYQIIKKISLKKYISIIFKRKYLTICVHVIKENKINIFLSNIRSGSHLAIFFSVPQDLSTPLKTDVDNEVFLCLQHWIGV